MTPKCSLRHYKRQISFPEAKVLLRHTALHPSVTSLATQNERVWTSFESELVEGRGLGVPGSHRAAVSIQTLQWERNLLRLCEAKDALEGAGHTRLPLSSKQCKTQQSLLSFSSDNSGFNSITECMKLNFTVMMTTVLICTTAIHTEKMLEVYWDSWGGGVAEVR